jgi:AcrR family transcriptional regulator
MLKGAAAIVRERGAAALTLDSVAERSDASKGGVLYHFPTKTALIAAMIDDEINAFELSISKALDAEVSGPGAYTRAYIRATLADYKDGDPGLGGILAAVANDEGILNAYRVKTIEWKARIASDGLDPARAEVLRLAVDGLLYSIAIGAAVPGKAELPAFHAALLELAAGGRTHV